MRFSASSFGVIAASLFTAVAAASDVIDLTATNFDKEILTEPLALVEFFAPWCGHCKALAPHYEEAATELKSAHNVKLAKVDCTENADLCQSYGVRGYPTLKVFKNGDHYDYGGTRQTEGIISYMIKQSLPAVVPVTPGEHEKFTAADKVVVVAYGDIPAAFNTVADTHRDSFLFGHASDVSLSPTGKPAIVLYKKFDEGQTVYSTSSPKAATVIGLTEWIKENSIPVMDQVSPENFVRYAEQGLPLAYLFSKPSDSKLEGLLEELKPIAKSHKGAVNFVWIDAVKFEEHGKSLGIPTSEDPYPMFVIQDLGDKGRKYLLKDAFGKKLTPDAVKSFAQDFVDGKLKPDLKSAPIPETQKSPVYEVVGAAFDDVVLDNSKDVLLAITAPWCGHCQRLAPIYEELAEHFADFKDTLIIGKMDGTENDLPLSVDFEIAGFPTIKFKKAGTTEFIDYGGDRSLEDMIEYIIENSGNPVELGDDVEVDEEEEDVAHDEL